MKTIIEKEKMIPQSYAGIKSINCHKENCEECGTTTPQNTPQWEEDISGKT